MLSLAAFLEGWSVRFVLAAIFLLLVAQGVNGAATNDVAATFEQANRLYEQGQYAAAASAYQTLVASGKVSAPLYFNYANALFKSGQIGRAVLNYHLAQRLAPRDPDIRANLQFARDTVSGGSAKSGLWKDWLRLFTLNELAIMAGVAVWIWFTLLTLGQIRSDWRTSLKGYTFTAGAACFLLISWLATVAYQRSQTRLGIVVVPEAVVRYGPLEESQSFYTVRDGAELAVLDKKDNWLQVQDGAGRIGWLRSEQTMLLPQGLAGGKS